jgi:putative intracellular protease/amidase
MAKKLGVVLYENVQPMDVIGPWEVLAIWKNLLHAPIEMHLISENGGPVKCDDDIVLNAQYNFNDSPELDYLIIPGGRGRREQVNNERLIAFIKEKAKTSEKIISSKSLPPYDDTKDQTLSKYMNDIIEDEVRKRTVDP